MVDPAGQVLDLRGQRATKGHVQFLDAAADRQKRHAALDGEPDERQRRGVPRRVVGAVRLRRLGSVERRVNVGLGARDSTPSTRERSVSKSRRSPNEGTSTGRTPAADTAASRYCCGAACQV